MTKQAKFLMNAEACEIEALRARNVMLRSRFLKMAAEWRQLARQVEQREQVYDDAQSNTLLTDAAETLRDWARDGSNLLTRRVH